MYIYLFIRFELRAMFENNRTFFRPQFPIGHTDVGECFYSLSIRRDSHDFWTVTRFEIRGCGDVRLTSKTVIYISVRVRPTRRILPAFIIRRLTGTFSVVIFEIESTH